MGTLGKTPISLGCVHGFFRNSAHGAKSDDFKLNLRTGTQFSRLNFKVNCKVFYFFVNVLFTVCDLFNGKHIHFMSSPSCSDWF